MSYPIARLSTIGVTRARTAELWRGVKDNYADAPNLGLLIWDDFNTPTVQATEDTSVNGWFLQETATAGAVCTFSTVDGNPDGIRALASADVGAADEGIQAHRGASETSGDIVNLPTHSTDPRGRVVCEAYLNDANGDGSPVTQLLFVGLGEAIDGGILTTGSVFVDTIDHIGIFLDPGGDLLFVTRNDNNNGDAVTDSAVLVPAASLAATFPDGIQKAGFAVNPDSSVEIYVNEVSYSVAAQSINPLALPIESLSPVLVVGRGGGSLTAVSAPFDWYGCYVEN